MWPPERDDVVVDLAVAGYLHQLDNALTPIADRFHPQRRALFVMRLQVLVVAELARALQQAEATRAAVGKCADLQFARIGERAPDLFALAVPDQQAGGIMYRGAIV